jgi:hypothetical protein
MQLDLLSTWPDLSQQEQHTWKVPGEALQQAQAELPLFKSAADVKARLKTALRTLRFDAMHA